MLIKKGVKLLEEKIGNGAVAKKGDYVVFHSRRFLNRGDEVGVPDSSLVEQLPPVLVAETEHGKMINQTCKLGRRQVIAPVEAALIGMREGGYRKVRASPHLAYGAAGLGDVPPNAVLTIEIWLVHIGHLA